MDVGHFLSFPDCLSRALRASQISPLGCHRLVRCLRRVCESADSHIPRTIGLSRFADTVFELFAGGQGRTISLPDAISSLPVKQFLAPPFASQDGGGVFSQPDWSVTPKGSLDRLRDFRQAIMRYLADQRLPVKVRSLAAQGTQASPFSEPVVAHMRQLFATWASDQGYTSEISWDKPAGQPYCLHALTVLSSILEDQDTMLWPSLLSGVSTGFDADIPPSHVFAPKESHPASDDLRICFGNWTGAEENPTLLAEFIQQEVASGWLEEVPDLAHAQERCLAVGRVNVVSAEGRKPPASCRQHRLWHQ